MANKNIFNSIKLNRPKRNFFDLTHDVKLSLNMGNLVPIMVQECVPGDKFNVGCESLLRFAPLIAPVMHRFHVTMHYFFVPNRLLWPGWEKWITGNAQIVAPYFDLSNSSGNIGSLGDYMGIPRFSNSGAPRLRVSALPFAAYQLIYDQYYRDQNLIASDFVPLADGVNNNYDAVHGKLRKRAWQHDYFTSALPWAQKGPAVDLPLGEVELREWDGTSDINANTGRWAQWDDHGVQPLGAASQINNSGQPVTAANNVPSVYDPNGTLEVQPTTINDLRRAFRLQEWLEKNARAGTRYVESILAHFGVKSPDARLQRPEYITGTKSPVVISEVLNTTGESEGLPQGNMAGHGVSVTSGSRGRYFCQEHGWIIGIMNVQPVTAYQQGIDRHFMKYRDRFEYFWPEFANIGEQTIYNAELYAQGNIDPSTGPDLQPFGYVPRYAEYRYKDSRVAGEFRTNLNYWHSGRIFENAPTLSQEFIEANPTTRIFAVTDENTHHIYAHVLNKINAIRPLPKFGVPMI